MTHEEARAFVLSEVKSALLDVYYGQITKDHIDSEAERIVSLANALRLSAEEEDE